MTAPDEMHAWMVDVEANVAALESKCNRLEDELVDLRVDHNTLAELFDRANPAPAPEPTPEPEPEPPPTTQPSEPPANMEVIEVTTPTDVLHVNRSNVFVRNLDRIGRVDITNGASNVFVSGGSVGSIVAMSNSNNLCFENLRMENPTHWDMAFEFLGAQIVTIMNVHATMARYGIYAANSHLFGVRDSSFISGGSEAALRFEGVTNARFENTVFESHFKQCLRAHGTSSAIAFDRCTLRGRWIQIGNHAGDDVRGFAFENGRIEALDEGSWYGPLDTRTLFGFVYRNNVHAAGYRPGTVEDAYGGRNDWVIEGNTYL